MQRQLLVAVLGRAAGEHGLDRLGVEAGELGAALAERAPEKLGVQPAGEARVGVVVEHDAVLAPQHQHRHRRAKQDRGGGLQALRPVLDRAQRRRRPVERRDQGRGLAIVQEPGTLGPHDTLWGTRHFR